MFKDLPFDVNWLEEIQQPPSRVSRPLLKLAPLLADNRGRLIETWPQWRHHRLDLYRAWADVLGLLEVERCSQPGFEVLEEVDLEGIIRTRIRYEPEPGWPTEAYLLRPADVEGPLPGVIAFHSTVPESNRQAAGIEGEPAKAFGLKLAQHGCVAICPRCFLWGMKRKRFFHWQACRRVRQLRGRHPRATGMAKMIHDAQVAVDILASLPQVDPHRLGAIGHSLGGKQVLYLAALDERIRVAVSSEVGIGRQFSNWSAPWYLGRRFVRSNWQRRHHELLGLVAPRAFLLVAGGAADGDHSWPYVEAALEVYQLHGQAARIGLFNHRQGHTVPSVAEPRIHEWMETYQ